MISIDVIQRSAQMLLPDLDGCYWVISIHENTQEVARTMLDNGLDRSTVMKMTGLSEDDLSQLRH